MREGLRLVVFDNQRFLFHNSELKSIIDTIKLRTARERVGDRNEPIEEPISSGQMICYVKACFLSQGCAGEETNLQTLRKSGS
jgi:hypothetical protein